MEKNNILKTFNVEKTLMTLISVTAYLFLCLFSPIQMADGNQGTILGVLCKYNKGELLAYGTFYSVGTILNSFRDMQWFLVLLPIIVSLYPVMVMKEKFFSHSYYNQVIREGRKRYSRKYLAEAVRYVIAVNNLSLIMFFIVICMKFPWGEDLNGNGLTGITYIVPMAKVCLMTTLVALLLLCISFVIMNISGDIFFAITLPMLICYIGYKVLNIHLIYIRKSYGTDFPDRSLRLEIFNPAYLIHADLVFEKTFGMNITVLYSALSIVVLVMIYAIYRWMNRRVYGS